MDVKLQDKIINWGKQLGLTEISFANIDLSAFHNGYLHQVDNFADMTYLARNIDKRFFPDVLRPTTTMIITASLNYYPQPSKNPKHVLGNPNQAYISRYALGRDYHKVFRNKLKKLAEKITQYYDGFSYRVFCDSAPVLELALAQKSGIGWRGKNNCIINRNYGSWFFLGEIYTNLEFDIVDAQVSNHCGECTACLSVCPTDAFDEAYKLNPSKCISYLTIEHNGSIPVNLRKLIGNRIYGCDDCQIVCPWNKFKQNTQEIDFKIRHHLDDIYLAELWQWSETEFLDNFQGSPIRRIGFEKWQRNLAVAIGNSSQAEIFVPLLQAKLAYSDLTASHINWAIKQLELN